MKTKDDSKIKQKEVSNLIDIPLSLLDEFPNHPFKVRDDEDMLKLIESVSERGVLVPAIVRPKADGRYELLSGHRRKRASEYAGKNDMRCIVSDIDDDAATIIMVDSNIQREHILPSEKAFAYKMKLNAMKHQGKRIDLTSTQVVPKLRSNEELAEQVGESRETIRRYIRLLDFKYDIFKHPKFSLTEDGGAKPYVHNEVNRDVANIEILNIPLKNIEKMDVPVSNYELLTETELEKELEKELNSNEKTEKEKSHSQKKG